MKIDGVHAELAKSGYGDKRGVGDGVRRFQTFEIDEVRVVLVEMIPKVDVNFYYFRRAGGKAQYDKHGEQYGQPSAVDNERQAGCQFYVGRLYDEEVPSIASGGRVSTNRTPAA